MASRAGPPSGRSFDVAYFLSQIAEQVRQVEMGWEDEVRVSDAGRRRIAEFAWSFLSDLEQRGLPPGIDATDMLRQLSELVPDFLESVRIEASESGTIINRGYASEIPADLIARRLPSFMAQRCHCWPQ